jgi:hypothetical protein
MSLPSTLLNNSIVQYTQKDTHIIGLGKDLHHNYRFIVQKLSKLFFFSVGSVSESGHYVHSHTFIVYGDIRYWNPQN